MAWVDPKINWYGNTDASGTYAGDRFNASDFNRIKNNLDYLRNLAITLYPPFSITSLGEDRTPYDYLYADEINAIEGNLEVVNDNTINGEYGASPTYYDNGNTIDFSELNRIESATLNLFNLLTNQFNGRRTFTWNFGTKGGEL